MAKFDPKAVSIWTARTIPLILIGTVGYASYVLVSRLCVSYLLSGPRPPRPGPVTAILILYFLLLLLMSATYFRTLYSVTVDPGFVPLGRVSTPLAPPSQSNRRHSRRNTATGEDVGGTEYVAHSPEAPEQQEREAKVVDWHTDADAPGLEEFYSKDVFVCERDGRPRWCTECRNWKPDRAHHCRDVGRCVRKMDHFCPWVGGVVAENNFKFFLQFVTYTALFCTLLMVVMAVYLHEQLVTENFTLDPQIAAILGIATFFGLFTFGMTVSAGEFALSNITTIENLNRKSKVWQLAVFLPNTGNPPPVDRLGVSLPTVTYPLPLATEKPISAPSSSQSDSSTIQAIQASQSPTPPSQSSRHAERDAKAIRTFAILHMEPGGNPWDLGYLRNWKTVMGNHVLDWFLPITRSPCCNHESDISQFMIGHQVERLKADNGLGSRQRDRRGSRSSHAQRSRRNSRRENKTDLEMGSYGRPP